MASANQLKALINSYLEGEDQRFWAVAMQVAAHEAKLGHGKLAQEIRALIDQAKCRQGLVLRTNGQQTPITRAQGDLNNLLVAFHPKSRLGDMIVGDDLGQKLARIIREQRQAERILAHGLFPRRKLMLVGPPGTGKTMTAAVLAGELGLPLLQVRLDGLITRYMGETSSKLRQVFDATNQTRGVYFFDEFDAIGANHALGNDVGEIRRVLNSFLLMIEQDRSNSLIIAATNHPGILDNALFRRFDDVLHYELPDTNQIALLLRTRLSHSATKCIAWDSLAETAAGLSHSEVARVTDDVLKEALIDQREQITEADIRQTLVERQGIAYRLKGTP